ncbi:MAG: amidohydrolase [Desulfobacteraceae bacterium]|nr:amidohydrolase [Desulfobacteraceae bacterium]
MNLNPTIVEYFDDLKAIRRKLHTFPEIGTQTVETAAFIKSRLDEYGIGHEDIGENSVIARVEGRASGKTVAFRADIDGLEISEKNDFSHRSETCGKMHACGHDGHAATLLGLARYISTHREFDGAVLLLFQSGEEGYGGALKIIGDGLFDKYDIDYMFGYHNWPGMATGQIAVHPGPCMASEDRFDIIVTGRSGHASMPHGCIEPFAPVADIIKGAQSIIARKVPSHDRAVVSITQVHGGSAYNIIPDSVTIRGNVRTCNPGVQDMVEDSLREIIDGVSKMYGVETEFTYNRLHPVLVNQTPGIGVRAGEAVAGKGNVVTDILSAMGSEDYAFYMEKTKGCFMWIGNGEESPLLHNSRYDFNDELLLVGASLFVALIDELL